MLDKLTMAIFGRLTMTILKGGHEKNGTELSFSEFLITDDSRFTIDDPDSRFMPQA
jgi:hypothetical protein